jgi:hypothetical protein
MAHFYSPLPDLEDVRRRRREIFDRSARSLPAIDLNEAAQLALLSELQRFYAEQPFQAARAPGLRYHFENGFYSYSDALFLYGMLRHAKPRRYFEIGSGFTSALALDVNERFLEDKTRIVLVEPYPQRLRSLLLPGDEKRMELLDVPLQQVDPARFAELEPNDILLVDSSHVSKVGSDVNRIIFEILPLLAKGVYIHFHDIFYPFQYPEAWIMKGIAWNEAYLLRAFLQYNHAFEIVLFNTYLEQMHPEWFAEKMPLCLKNPGGSLWLRKRA